MAFRTRKVADFSTLNKDVNVHGENVVSIKGGSVAIGDTWIQFKGTKIDLQDFVEKYITNSRRLFNQRFGVLYVLIAINEKAQLEVIPSISYNKTSTGDVKVFPSLSSKLPIMVVKLTQDGSYGLTGISRITESDVEQYLGYGNFTLRGPQGETGGLGSTGFQGLTGFIGATGYSGPTGLQGETGINSFSVKGYPGVRGEQGESLPAFEPTRYAIPVANFVGAPLSGEASLSVSFTDLSNGNPTSWLWDFGDGNTSTQQNPTHSYASAGTYTVSLVTTSPAGEDQEIKYDYITVTEALAADFAVTPTEGDERVTTFNFDGSFSAGTITSYSWDFGDSISATGETATHVYNGVSGQITVSLTVTGPSGSDTVSKTITVDGYIIQSTTDDDEDTWQDTADSSEDNVQNSSEE